MKRLILLIAISTNFFVSHSQEDSTAISILIEDFFSYMRTSNAAEMEKILHQELFLATTGTDVKGMPGFQSESRAQLLEAIGARKEEKWNEYVRNIRISVDDNLAIAWMDYSFYVDTFFHHCGVNAFQFIRTVEGWKIISIIDTRRKEPCTEQ